jgi:hypothetical protein
MSSDGQEKLLKPDRAKRRGHPIYESNPSADYTLPVWLLLKRQKLIQSIS